MERPPDFERSLEVAVWQVVIELGAALLTACLALAFRWVTERATGGRQVRLRLDDDHTLSRSTPFGTVGVHLFA